MEAYLEIPDGMELPRGAEDGEEFDAAIRCELEDGKLCVKSINGIPYPKEKEVTEDDKMSEMTPSQAAGTATY